MPFAPVSAAAMHRAMREAIIVMPISVQIQLRQFIDHYNDISL
jgi:hypothetical protein